MTNSDTTKILVPVKVAGKLTGYDAETMTVLREADVTLTFDLTNANAHFSKFVNAQGKDKIAPAYNLLSNFIVPEDKDVFEQRLKADHAALMGTLGELVDILVPNVEKTTKNFLNVSS